MLRDRFSRLLEQLLADRLEAVDLQLDADGDVRASVRLLANALLNLASSVGPGALDALRRVTPWLEVFLRRELEGGAGESSRLPPTAEALDRADGPLEDRLAEAARDAGRLDELRELPDAEFADRLVRETRSAKLVCRAVACGEPAGLGERARRLFPPIADAGPRDATGALDILEQLEAGREHALHLDPDALGGEARRFETSLAANMDRQGMSPAVRAALAFGPCGDDELAARLFAAPLFREQPELAELAGALAANRGRAARYLRGGAPLEHLAGWADYLRSGCRELARRRDVSYREAVSFAHFCFHLTNVCELAARDARLTDEVRDGLMAVEDELKEFALAGRRSSLADGVSDLPSYDEHRWASSPPAAYLGDRLARLAGAWRHPVERGPIGTPPRLDDALEAAATDVWREADASTREALARALRRMRLTGIDALAPLDLDEMARLLALAATYARDLPGLDVTDGFWLDLSGLPDADGASRGVARRALRELLQGRALDEIVGGRGEPDTPDGVGLVGDVSADPDDEPAGDAPTLRLHLELDAESTALLSLLEDAFDGSDDDSTGRLHAELRQKVRAHFDDTPPPDDHSSPAA